MLLERIDEEIQASKGKEKKKDASIADYNNSNDIDSLFSNKSISKGLRLIEEEKALFSMMKKKLIGAMFKLKIL